MSHEPEALRLADRLTAAEFGPSVGLANQAANELRRLVADRDSWIEQASDRVKDYCDLLAECEADRAAMREVLESLEQGRDALRADADQFHCAMRGYKPEEHEAMDEAVRRADAAIEKLKARTV